MALKTMGIVKNYERVRDFSVAIVGIGGVGVSVAEMLTRCGIGKIVVYDNDTIELCNMNKMFYRPEQAGWNKTMACRQVYSLNQPNVRVEIEAACPLSAGHGRAAVYGTRNTGERYGVVRLQSARGNRATRPLRHTLGRHPPTPGPSTLPRETELTHILSHKP